MKKILISAGASLAESIQVRAVVKAFRKLGFNPVYLRYWHKRLPKGINISKLYPVALLNGEKLFLAAKKEMPDLLLVLKGETFLHGSIARIKKLGIRTINWTVDDVFGVHNPFNRIVNIAEYDYVFSYDRYCVEELKMRGLNAHYLTCTIDPDVYKEIPEIKSKYDVTFIGSHLKDREKILGQLLDFDLHIWGGGWLRGVRKTSSLYSHIHKEASYGVEMPKILNQSRITLNIHNKQSILSTNFRTFEALACKTFILSDYNKELGNLFQLDKELVCYRNIEELKKLIRYYLDNEKERKRIAEAGQKKVYKEYTTLHWAEKIIEVTGTYKRMRIGIGVQSLLNHHGRGIEKYIQYFLKALAKVDSANEYVLLQENIELEGSIFQSNFLSQSYHISARNYPCGLRWLWEYVSLPREIEHFKLDLYHSLDLGIPRYGRGIYLVTVHDILPYLYPRTCQISPRQLLKYRLKLWSLKRADHIIAISECTKNDLVTKLGLSARRITVIPYGIADIFRPIDIKEARTVIKDKFGIECSYLLYVGAFGPTKNIPVLLRSFRHVVERFPNYRLVLVGSQKHPNYNQLIILSRNLGIESKIIWIDSLEHEDLVSLYSAAHLFVFPSLLEGFGLPPLEAMACGAPVIASKAASLPEVVGDAGILVDPRNVDDLSRSMIRVLSSDTMRLEMKARGLKQAAQFSWKENARKTLGVYQKILESTKKVNHDVIN